MTDKESSSSASDKASEKTTAKKAAAKKTEEPAPSLAGVSQALSGPTTADLNPAYNYVEEDADKK